MSWFDLAVSWIESPAANDEARAMSAARADLAPDGIVQAKLRRAVGVIGRRAVTARDRAVIPEVDGAASVLVVGDVRLYNRADLVRALGLEERGQSDLTLVRHGYERWGSEVAKHLVGDFAFAVWDERRGRIIAARDHFGVRPLYYRVTMSGALLATDVGQILAATPMRIPFNAERILDYLLSDYSHHGQTFFKDVALLRPGYTLTITPTETSERRYWYPPTTELPFRSHDEVSEAFSSLFSQSVRERLESEYPIVAHMSGGFDSTSILEVASAAYRAEPNRPRLVTASATMPGLEGDETHNIDIVERHVQLTGCRWSARQPDTTDMREPALSAPGIRRGLAGGPPRDLEYARDVGARVLLAGFGGDAIAYSGGIFRDLLRRVALRTLVAETLFSFPRAQALRFLIDARRGLVPPRYVSKIRSRSPGRDRRLPRWLGPELRAIYPGRPDTRDDLTDHPWNSHTQRGLWRSLTDPQTAESLDSLNSYAAGGLLELRLPYLDVRLAELVMAVPTDLRLPHGDMRRLQREALRPIMPPEIAARRGQIPLYALWIENTKGLLPETRALMHEATWLSAPFIDRAEARVLLPGAESTVAARDWPRLRRVADFGMMEAWIRSIFMYYSSREVSDVRVGKSHDRS